MTVGIDLASPLGTRRLTTCAASGSRENGYLAITEHVLRNCRPSSRRCNLYPPHDISRSLRFPLLPWSVRPACSYPFRRQPLQCIHCDRKSEPCRQYRLWHGSLLLLPERNHRWTTFPSQRRARPFGCRWQAPAIGSPTEAREERGAVGCQLRQVLGHRSANLVPAVDIGLADSRPPHAQRTCIGVQLPPREIGFLSSFLLPYDVRAPTSIDRCNQSGQT